MKIRRVWAELLHVDGRTDGQTDMTRLIVAFRNFARASNEQNTRRLDTVYVKECFRDIART
jgi:hypothetical protein